MKSNPLAGFLVVVLVACAIWTAWIMYVYTYSTGKIRALEPRYAYMENMRVAAQTLANDALHYSRQHPAIDPVLQRFGIKGTNQLGKLPPAKPVAPVQPR